MADGASLFTGNEATSSAKRRRQNDYRKDLELQMRENEAAKLRERYQGMSVNASGWLDPEKRPDRLKPLGGSALYTDRSERDSKVRAYHTLFNYGQRQFPGESPRAQTIEGHPYIYRDSPIVSNTLRLSSILLDNTAGLHHYPLTEATAGQLPAPHNSVNNAYNFYATRDLDRPGGYGSFIQPLVVPYVDNRPIIMPGSYQQPSEPQPRYNPFLHDDSSKDLKALLGLSQLEQERAKAQMTRDNDDSQRKMRKELEDERRKLIEQEAETRRKLEAMRREYDERRREYERQRNMPKATAQLPNSPPLVVRPPSTTLLADMDDTRRRLIDERIKIEELLRAQTTQPDYTQVKVLKRPPPPPTPPITDKANLRNVEEFTYLKHQEAATRRAFRNVYPDIPETNMRLEHQQRALLRQQEENIRNNKPKTTIGVVRPSHKYGRPDWMDKTPTPFPHRLRDRDRLYMTTSVDDLDRIYRRAERRDQGLKGVSDSLDADTIVDQYERMRLRSHRPLSTETLTDDTWLRPTSVAAF